MKAPILAFTAAMCTPGWPGAIAQNSSMPGKPTMAMGAEHQMAELQANQEAMQSTPAK